ncbi:mitochondrial carrier [Meredithblackwellia eburnea MCA 4105]
MSSTTFGQPLEVLKTHCAANRSDSLTTAISKTYARGGYRGFWQGLIPWAWIESSTSGGVLLFTSSFVETQAVNHGVSKGTAGLMGGILGGAAQAYLSMGVCTTMKTAEVTRLKATSGQGVLMPSSVPGMPGIPYRVPSTWEVFMDTYREGGIRAINKGVNAVALRQMTNWGSRMGFARASEGLIREARGMSKDAKLSTGDKVVASAIGGALGCWNHPIEVIRVEMQSLQKAKNRPAKPTILNTFQYIYKENGAKGLFRGITPRILLGVWRTICLVTLADMVKDLVQPKVSSL